MNEIIHDLLKPENRILLWVLIVLYALIAAYLLYLTKQGHLHWKFPFVESSYEKSDADKPGSGQSRRYRKVLYVKVTCLSDRARVKEPSYHRPVNRLAEGERAVPVFDEAVYYTLELFPNKSAVSVRKERSSGVVDPRVVIPWQDEVAFRDAGAREVKSMVELETDGESDAFLSISHFENGLQGAKDQYMATDVPEDAEFVRMVVDFSSIPNADRFITGERAFVSLKGQNTVVPIAQHGPGVFSVVCADAKKSSVINFYFRFDWDRSI